MSTNSNTPNTSEEVDLGNFLSLLEMPLIVSLTLYTTFLRAFS